MIARRVLVAAAVALSCATLAGAATAARAPSAKELVGIARLLRVPGRCLYVRVSTADHHFAKLAFRVPTPPACARYLANGVTVARYDGRRWHQVFAGSDIRCPVRGVPAAVSRDLHLCP